MKRKTIFQGSLAFLLIGVVTINLAFAGSVKHLFRPKIARAAFDIECNCAAFGGNNSCLANNYGSLCAPAGTTMCTTYNSNCGG